MATVVVPGSVVLFVAPLVVLLVHSWPNVFLRSENTVQIPGIFAVRHIIWLKYN